MALRTLSVLTLVALSAVAAACGDSRASTGLAAEGPAALAALALEVRRPAADDTTAARAVVQSDRAGAFYYDALAAPQDDPAMGFIAGGYRMLDGWRWWLERDSVALGPHDRLRGVARPDFALRYYAQRDTAATMLSRLTDLVARGRRPALAERVALLDGRGALVIDVPDSLGTVAFRPVVSDRAALRDYTVEARGTALLFARADYMARPDGETRPVWVAVRASGDAVARANGGQDVPEGRRDRALVPGEVAFATPGTVVVATADTPAAADSLARLALRDAEQARAARSARMAALLRASPLDTGDDTVDLAFGWAVLTLDGLVAEDSARARLWPGVPGTDPHTALSAMHGFGAWLGLGRFETARSLLAAFGDAQRFDRRIDLLGRAPDLVPPADPPVFATTDATARYLAAAGDYVRATGDRTLVTGRDNFWFKSVFALRGLYEPDSRRGNPVSPEGFLLARQSYGSWADMPDERRAGALAEAQGALARALRATFSFAEIMGVAGRESGRWYADSARTLEAATLRRFTRSDTLLVDRFGPDGQALPEVRPGGLLALADLARTDALPPREAAARARRLAERLVFPHGVATLAQSDARFHPFVRAPGYYAPDEARFNGTVWTWLAGPAMTVMAQTGGAEPAGQLLRAQAELLLDVGVVGGLPEMLDGHPRASRARPQAAGAPLQLHSLMAFVAAVYEGFLGLGYADAATATLAPALPPSWGETRTRIRLGDGHVTLTLRQTADALEATLVPEGALPEGAAVRVRAFGREMDVPLASGSEAASPEAASPEAAGSSAGRRLRLTAASATLDGADAEATPAPTGDPAWWSGFAFAAPDLRTSYPVMEIVRDQRQLTPDQLTRDNLIAEIVLTETDPDGDDWGATSTFVYPRGFPAGVLDATYLEVARDDSTTYFRAEFTNLVPRDSLGFPPTMVAIAIDTEAGGVRRVGRGADYEFPRGEGYQYVLFIGDGVLIEDARGRVLGELPPGQSVFDYRTGSLTLSVPTFALPRLPRGARVTMLVGARTSGGGVGEFRRVAREATEDVGGGRVDTRSPNVYDVVVGRISR